jgi:hypothetical protein
MCLCVREGEAETRTRNRTRARARARTGVSEDGGDQDQHGETREGQITAATRACTRQEHMDTQGGEERRGDDGR